MNGTYVAADSGQALGVFSYYEGLRNQGSKCFHLLRFLWPNQQLKKLSVEGESLIPRFTLSSSMFFFLLLSLRAD